MESIHVRRRSIQPLKRSAGFTLIELLVVLAIIVVITTVALTSQSSFNKTLILSNTAYDIALTLRSAETFGISSRARFGANVGYGLHFDKANQNSFVFFADTDSPKATNCHGLPLSGDIAAPDALPGDCVYKASQDQKVSDYTIANGITVSDFCTYSAAGKSGASGAGIGGISTLDIVFTRPNPDAFMSTNGSYSTLFPITQACLIIASPNALSGPYRYVVMEASGEIAVTANIVSCP